MSAELVPLRSMITEIRNGLNCEQYETASDASMLPISRIETISDGTVDFARVNYVNVSYAERHKYQLQLGDILFSHINSPEHIGKTAIFRSDHSLIHGVNLLLLRPDPAVCHPEYLNYYLKSFGPRATFRSRCKKAVNQASLNQGDVTSLLVPRLPLPEQKRIATFLEKADRLRRLRCYARELSDTYLQSVFLEMFGDPVKNPRRWERAKVSDLGKVQTGNTPSRDNPLNYGNYIEWLKSDNIIEGYMFVSKSREMLSKQGAKIGRMVEAGSVLVTCIAGSPTSIGNVALTDRLVAFNQQINSVTPYKDVDQLFLYGMLKVAKPLVQRSTTLGMKRIITKSNFEKLVLIKPPQPQQQRFAGIIQKFERLRSQQREAERQVEHLFQTLVHRAFRGQLTAE